MTVPLAQEFAQVEAGLVDCPSRKIHAARYHCPACEAVDATRAALSRIERHVQEMEEAADRLSFEVQYFDEHPPESCAMKRAALWVDRVLVASGKEIHREGAAALPAQEGAEA